MSIFYEEQAKLLYQSAKSQRAIERVKEDIALFKDGVGGEKMFVQMVTRDNVSNVRKAELIADITEHFHEVTKHFFSYFTAEAQYQYIFRAVQSFENIYAEHHLDIVSAVPLTDTQVEKIKKGAGNKMQREFHTTACQVDENIIAGVIVRSKDFVFDTSILTQLKEFKKSF